MNGTLKKPTRDAFRSWWNIYYAAGISVDRDTMSLHMSSRGKEEALVEAAVEAVGTFPSSASSQWGL
ncbi:hypothetical protein CapIbe_005380 [Capra ibex]